MINKSTVSYPQLTPAATPAEAGVSVRCINGTTQHFAIIFMALDRTNLKKRIDMCLLHGLGQLTTVCH